MIRLASSEKYNSILIITEENIKLEHCTIPESKREISYKKISNDVKKDLGMPDFTHTLLYKMK